jgi:uncharacterized protein (TIGR01777 family)
MGVKKFVYRSHITAPAETVFSWFDAPGAFERLLPPWLAVKMLELSGGIKDGSLALAVTKGPFSVKWSFQHDQYVSGRQFRDYQIEGPFKLWAHLHQVEPDGEDGCYLVDSIEYELPAGVPAKFIASHYIDSELRKLFSFRHKLIASDIEQQRQYGEVKRMKVLISGSTGLIGAALTTFMLSQGHSVVRLIRPKSHANAAHSNGGSAIVWDPDSGKIDSAALEGFDAVIHLGGENLADGRWSEARKSELIKSRVESTRLLSQTLASLKQPPKVFLVASAIGFYGNRGEETLDEGSSRGPGFLAELCEAWESACQPAAKAGIRVVNLRLGVVLSTKGGALAKMLLPFQLGAGGEIGNGGQYFSWVSLDDVSGAVLHALKTESLSGPVNITAPNPVTNKQFTKALGKVLVRPTLIPIPTFGLRALFGEMADECLIAGQKVMPVKLQKSNYQFRNTEIEPTLRQILGH